MIQQTMHTIHEVVQISSCESVWYTAGLSEIFLFQVESWRQVCWERNPPTTLPSLWPPKSFFLGVQLLGDEDMPKIQ